MKSVISMRTVVAGLVFCVAPTAVFAQATAGSRLKLETLGISTGMTLAQAEAAAIAAGYVLLATEGPCAFRQMDYHAGAGLPARPASRRYMLKDYTCVLPMDGSKQKIPNNRLELIFSPVEPVVIAISRYEKIDPPVHPDRMQSDLLGKWGTPTYQWADSWYWAVAGMKEQPNLLVSLCKASIVLQQDLSLIRSRSRCQSAVNVRMVRVPGAVSSLYDAMDMEIADFALANEQIERYVALQRADAKSKIDAARKNSGPKL